MDSVLVPVPVLAVVSAVEQASAAAQVLVVASAAAPAWAAVLYRDLVAAWAVAWALDLASYPDLSPDSALASDSASVVVLYLDSAPA